MSCPNCGAQGGGPSGCSSCGLGKDPSVGGAFNAGQDELRQNYNLDSSGSGGSGGSGSRRGCFAGDSEILTPNGNKRLDSIKKGDIVLGFKQTGKIVPVTVKRATSHRPHQLVHVISKEFGLSFRATKKHPVLTKRGWVAIKNLQPGDVLTHLSKNGKRTEHIVQDIIFTKVYENVYNIIVDGNHTYAVNGYVVHSFVSLRILRCWISSCKKRFFGNYILSPLSTPKTDMA